MKNEKKSRRTCHLSSDLKDIIKYILIFGTILVFGVYLLADAEIGDEVEIESVNGRRETGTFIELEPYYTHDYGVCVPELLAIDKQVREILFGGDK